MSCISPHNSSALFYRYFAPILDGYELITIQSAVRFLIMDTLTKGGCTTHYYPFVSIVNAIRSQSYKTEIIDRSLIGISPFKENIGKGCIAGCLLFAHAVLHGFAISLTKAAYMISVKRLSVLIGFAYGWLIFKEKDLPVRLIGTVLMVAGAALITIWGN